MSDNLKEIHSENSRHDLKLLVSENLEHPIMLMFLAKLNGGIGLFSGAPLYMKGLYDHLTWLKDEFQIVTKSQFPDLAIVMTYAECCGHTIIIKKGAEEIRLRYNPKAGKHAEHLFKDMFRSLDKVTSPSFTEETRLIK